jgi:endonuclease/exonuclease/phosphatase (EEP) superfamily protein YafD
VGTSGVVIQLMDVEQASPRQPPRWKRFLLPSWSQRKRMLRVEAWAVVIGAYVLFTLAYAWPQDYRNESPAYVLVAWAAFLVRVLQFHLGLLLGAIGLVAAFGRGRRLFLTVSPLVLFLLGPPLWSYLNSPMGAGRSPAADQSPALRVMSANLLMVNHDTQGIIDEILAARPDVVLLQEYTDHWHAAVKPALSQEYPFSSVVTQDDSFGVAVYSRTPFVDGDVDNHLPLGRSLVPQTRAVVRFAGREVAVYNVHLLPPRNLDYAREGRLQFADLLKTLSGEKLPYVVAGDWNFTGDVPQHRDLARLGARDAHDLAGTGRGATWPVNSFLRYLPGLRFDHVYVGPGLTAAGSEVGLGRGSDHRPVIADVTIDAPPVPPAPSAPPGQGRAPR